MPFLRAAGLRLEYEWFGAKSSKSSTLIFLHEGLGSLAMWGDFPARVCESLGCSALVYSRAGYGKSSAAVLPRPVRFMHDEALIVLPEILRHFEIEKPVLIGHSDGGSIALIYAGSNPSSVSAMVLEAPHVFTEDLTIQSIAAAGEKFKAGELKRRLAKYHANAEHTFLGWSDIWLHPDFRFWNIEEFLPPIRCPFLVIQGEDDQYGTLAQVEAIEKGAAGFVETLIVPDCGHSPHRDQPAATLQATIRFLRDRPPRRALEICGL